MGQLLRILRYLSAAILALVALGVTVALPFELWWFGISPRVDLRADLGFAASPSFLLVGAFLVWGAVQILRDRPKSIAWIAAGSTAYGLGQMALFAPLHSFRWFWFAVVPFAYLIIREVMKQWSARAEPSSPEQPEEAPTEGGSVLELAVIVLAIVGQNWLGGLLPKWMQISEPASGSFQHWIDQAVVLVAVVAITLVVHETGHAIGGWLVGFRLWSFAVYPFQYIRLQQKSVIKMRWASIGRGGYAGIPLQTANLERRILWMVACGPAMGLLFSLLCWGVLLSARGSLSGWRFEVLYASMQFGFLVNVMNLLPWKRGAQRLDGRILWDAIFDRRVTEDMVAVGACSSSLRSPLHPRDWTPEWVASLGRYPQDALATTLLGLSAEARWLADSSDESAQADLRQVSENVLRIEQRLKLQGALLAAFELHRAWLRGRYFGEAIPVDTEQAIQATGAEPYEVMRYDALQCALRGERDRAVEILLQAEAALSERTSIGEHALNLEVLRHYRSELLQPPVALSV